MIRSLKRSLGLGIVALVISASFASSVLAGNLNASGMRNDRTYDRFIVRFARKSLERDNPIARQQLLDSAGKASGVGISQLRRLATGADVIRTNRKLDRTAAQQLMQRLANSRYVDYVEVDALLKPAYTPNDPSFPIYYYNYSFGNVYGIDMKDAWDYSTGSGGVVAVIDTGVTSHGDLNANILPGYDFVSDWFRANDGNGRDADPSDPGDWTSAGECYSGSPATNSSWHGTSVAGIAAEVGNNGYGGVGVAFNAKILPVRALGKCGGNVTDIADAIVWAANLAVPGVPSEQHAAATVINLSLGGPGACSFTMQQAIDMVVNVGVTVVVAAGNDNADVAGYSPANCDHVITVGAMAFTGNRASYSNYGSKIDITAPGSEPGGDASGFIFTTGNYGTTTPGVSDAYFGTVGTSMSAPHVAGTVALMQSASARWNSPATIESIIKVTARSMPVWCPEGCGAGVVSPGPAIRAALAVPSLTISAATVSEGNSGTSLATFTVTLSHASSTPVTYDIATGDSGAIAGSDYVAKSLVGETIPAGQTSKTFTVTINGDTAVEANEEFVVNVTHADGAASRIPGVGTIVNDDIASLSVDNVSTIEGNSGTKSMTFTVSLSQPSVTAVTYDIFTAYGAATPGTDYVAKSLTAETIAAGQTSKTFTVTTNGDAATEPNEAFLVNLTNATGATIADSQGIGTIINDDGPTLSIADVSIAEGNSGTQVATFTVKLSQAASTAVSYNIATASNTAVAGSDFVAASLVGESIPAGQTSKTFTVTVNGDTAIEANESIIVNLSSSAGASIADSQAVGTILNDDGPTLWVGNASVTEGNSGTRLLTYTVTLSQPAATAVTYNIYTAYGTATAGTDYAASSLTGETIAAGLTSRTFTVTINGDTSVEPNETLLANISYAAGASILHPQGTGTIVNDD